MDTNNLFSKKYIISYLVLGLIILAIPLLVQLVQKQTQLKSSAASADFRFVEQADGSVKCDSSKENCITTSQTIQLKITSPF